MTTDLGIKATKCYTIARKAIADSRRMVVLHIGHEQTGVVVGDSAKFDDLFLLPVGSHKTAREYFRGYPPTFLELEIAIAAVEDAIMKLRLPDVTELSLSSKDATIADIAALAGVARQLQMKLSVNAMERVFDRFAALASGRPASQDNLPASVNFAATLLILREFMHHTQFAEITALTLPAPDFRDPDDS
jgi:exopolyphosphatase/pppGpp-phosphohydrolase